VSSVWLEKVEADQVGANQVAANQAEANLLEAQAAVVKHLPESVQVVLHIDQ